MAVTYKAEVRKKRKENARNARRSTQNAQTHGLTTVRRNNPVYRDEIAQLAEVFCSGESDPVLYQRALGLATAMVLLRQIDMYKHFLITRLRYPQRFRTTNVRGHLQYNTRDTRRKYGLCDEAYPPRSRECPTGRSPNAHALLRAALEPPKLRDDMDAFLMAIPELLRIARYERDAWRMWNRAFREYLYIKAVSP
jgi:hypothetical protein